MGQVFCARQPAQAPAPPWQLDQLRWLLLGHYTLFGVQLGVQGVLWDDLKRALHLSDSAFGTAMLVTPLVGFIFLLAGGAIWRRFSRRALALAGLSVIASALLMLVLARDLAVFLAARMLAGLGFALLESAGNNAAIDWERASGRAIVSILYAAFSIGAVLGALVAGLLLSAGWGYREAILTLLPLWLLLIIFTRLAAYPAARQLPAAARARLLTLLRDRRYMLLATVCLLGSVSEALADTWSVIYLRALGADALLGGAAFALFSGAMIAGRLANAAIAERWSVRAALRCSCASVAGAVGLLALGGTLASAIAFAILGLGVAGVLPTALSAVRRQLPQDEGDAANGIVAIAYLGFVIAGPLFGWLAELFGMQAALPAMLGVIAIWLYWLSCDMP
jgi:MFS family permease